MLQILFAFAAGVLTIASPCVLPMAPILLGSSIAQPSRSRPLFIVLGFVAAFSAAALVLGAFSDALPISPALLRNVAAIALAVFGVLMLWTRPMRAFGERLGGVMTRVDGLTRRAGSGNAGGLVLGLALGALWTPCAGPVLASILTLIATAMDLPRAALLLGCYALGAGMPMLAIAYGGRYATTHVRRFAPYAAGIQRAFGVLVIAVALATAFQLDTLAIAWISDFLPEGASPL
ncbi:MAG: cytochrome c biogenesis CcdA family protein [Burkholderiales bacterium]